MAVLKTCQQCKTEFSTPNRRAETVKFCSLACKTQAGWKSLACPQCGAAFQRKVSDLKGQTAYCSRECYDATKLGRLNAKPDAPRYEKVCEQCKVTFPVTKTRAATARFCSRACQSNSDAWRKECSEKQVGEKHWRYRGGNYSGSAAYAQTPTVNGVRFSVHRAIMTAHMAAKVPDHPFLYEKDGRKVLRTHIHVHHIDRDPANNALENLLALTIDAHAKLHHNGRKPEPWECWPPNPAKW
jgi:hypothetical protein